MLIPGGILTLGAPNPLFDACKTLIKRCGFAMGHQHMMVFIDKTNLFTTFWVPVEREKQELGPHADHNIADFGRKMQGTFFHQKTEDSQKLILGARAENTIKPQCV